jgi:hypothetical protein
MAAGPFQCSRGTSRVEAKNEPASLKGSMRCGQSMGRRSMCVVFVGNPTDQRSAEAYDVHRAVHDDGEKGYSRHVLTPCSHSVVMSR